MIARESFTVQHIRKLQELSKMDPSLLEKAIFASGLVESLVISGLPFIFKGGTCLLLLLEHPMRLSTDVDIMVAPDIDVDAYIKKVLKCSIFKSCIEEIRTRNSGINKRHFKFIYESPITGNDLCILLDVVFSEHCYSTIIECPIANELLLSDGIDAMVSIPNSNCILADKLTAFAPHTIGILLNCGKDMEIMKQMYDISILLNEFSDFNEVLDTYKRIAFVEIGYRGNIATIEDVIDDTYMASFCIASRGKIHSYEYPLYINGIRALRNHVYLAYSPENAVLGAVRIMYMMICIRYKNPCKIINDPSSYVDRSITLPELLNLAYLRKVNMRAYAYAIELDRLLRNKMEHHL